MNLSEKQITASLMLLIGLVVLLTYTSSLENGFTNWDDGEFLLHNPLILTPNFLKICQSCLAQGQGPLTVLTFVMDHRIASGFDPFRFHLTSLILHILVSWTVFFLIHKLIGRNKAALIGALIFSLHPVHVESVAWVSGRKDLLAALFFFWSLFVYQNYLLTGLKKHLILCFALFVLALASKPMAVTLPFVLILQDLANNRRALLEKIPFFLLSGAVGVLTYLAQQKAMPASDLYTNLLIGVRGIGFYLAKMVAPFNLSVFYPYPEKVSFIYPLISICVLILLFKLKRPMVLCLLFFLITLLPVLKFIPVGAVAAADRYLYIPSFGIILLAAGLVDTNKKVFAAALVVAVLGFLSFQRVQVWKDSATLWEDATSKHPSAELPWYNLGLAYREQGKHEEAMACYKKAIEAQPNNPRAFNNIAFILKLENKFKEAETYCRKALSLDKKMWEAHLNLANILGRQNKHEEACFEARIACDLNPNSSQAFYTLGILQILLKRKGDAILSLQRAKALDPGLTETADQLILSLK